MYGSSHSLIEIQELEKHEKASREPIRELSFSLPAGLYVMPLAAEQVYGLWTGPCSLEVQVRKDKSISVSLLTK